MKYAILVGDGMSDYPIADLGDKTPLEVAKIPHMNEIAKRGTVGLVNETPLPTSTRAVFDVLPMMICEKPVASALTSADVKVEE